MQFMTTNYSNKVKDIVLNIKVLRELRNYTQDYLAMRMKISQNAYSKIELGKSKLTLERLLHICAVLDVSFEEMISPNLRQASYRLVNNPIINKSLYKIASHPTEDVLDKI